MCILLDLVEVAVSHSGLNLATAFAKILDDFGISDKVSIEVILSSVRQCLLITCQSSVCASPVTMHPPMTP
jgi:hypothetical protein